MLRWRRSLRLWRKVIAGVAESGRKLYWKVQESEQGTLVRLAWKSAGCASANPVAEESKVAINWFQPQARDQFIRNMAKILLP